MVSIRSKQLSICGIYEGINSLGPYVRKMAPARYGCSNGFEGRFLLFGFENVGNIFFQIF